MQVLALEAQIKVTESRKLHMNWNNMISRAPSSAMSPMPSEDGLMSVPPASCKSCLFPMRPSYNRPCRPRRATTDRSAGFKSSLLPKELQTRTAVLQPRSFVLYRLTMGMHNRTSVSRAKSGNVDRDDSLAKNNILSSSRDSCFELHMALGCII